MGKKIHHDFRKVNKIPNGVPFVPLTYELLNSDAWRSQSIHCLRLINFLMIENMAHKGLENGNLIATYDQLVTFGIGRGYISLAISEASYIGLIEVHRGRNRGYANSDCNRFRLTFLFASQANETTGAVEYIEPTNEWRNTNKEDIKKWKQGKRLYKEQKKAQKLKSK